MNDISIEHKIELMLMIYRERLKSASIPPIDYAQGVRLSAQIELLETLDHYAKQHPAPAAQKEGEG